MPEGVYVFSASWMAGWIKQQSSLAPCFFIPLYSPVARLKLPLQGIYPDEATFIQATEQKPKSDDLLYRYLIPVDHNYLFLNKGSIFATNFFAYAMIHR